MKNIFIAFLASLLFWACSEKIDYNTQKATVSFKNASIDTKERVGMLKVPLTVVGARNGVITAEVDVEVINPEDCVEDENFIITSKHLNIPTEIEGGEVSVEIRVIDDLIINPDRKFRLKLHDVKGAEIAETNSEVLVTIEDNDSDPTERLLGKWFVESSDGLNNVSWECTTTIVDNPDGSKDLYMTPWCDGAGRKWDGTENPLTNQRMSIKQNSMTGEITLDIPLGEKASDIFDIDESTQGYVAMALWGNVPVTKGSVVLNVNEDVNEISYIGSNFLVGILMNTDGTVYYDAQNSPVPVFVFGTLKFTKIK